MQFFKQYHHLPVSATMKQLFAKCSRLSLEMAGKMQQNAFAIWVN